MKILQIIPRFVYPPDDGGKIGIANIYEEFSKENEVTLFSLTNESINDEQLLQAHRFGDVVFHKANTKNNWSNLLRTLYKKHPLLFFKHNPASLYKAIDEILIKQKFDIVHIDHSYLAPVGKYIKDKFKVPFGLRLHNIEYKIWERYLDELKLGSFKYRFIKRQAELIKERESYYISKADAAFPITEVDLRIAKQLAPNSNLKVASAGIDPKKWGVGKFVNRTPNRMIIASTWNWIHNENGLRWFINNVFPKLLNENRNAELVVLGKKTPNWLNDREQVINQGYVDSVLEYFHSSNVYVAPLFVGSGIRIKILEALASGLPVVATSVSAEGIEIGPEDGLFVSDDSETQAEIILELMRNKAKSVELGERAYRYVSEHYSWENSVRIMLEEYIKTIRK